MIHFIISNRRRRSCAAGFTDQGGLFSYIAPDKRVPANHPLRKVRELVRDVLSGLNRSLGRLYASEGRPSIPPEQLLSALLLQVFYGIRSERQLMEQLDYNLLYRWFVDCRRTIRSGTRPPSPEPGAAAERRCVHQVHDQASEPSAGQATAVGRALLGGWNADRSLGFTEELSPKDGSGDDDDGANFHGQKRRTTPMRVPATRTAGFIARRPDGAKLCYMGHATMENRHGWRWPAGSRMPMAPPNAGLRRPC